MTGVRVVTPETDVLAAYTRASVSVRIARGLWEDAYTGQRERTQLEFDVASTSKKPIGRLFLACAIAVLSLAGCSTESRHRTIVYDEAWSSAAALKNLVCSPDRQASCEREARDGEQTFAKGLSAAFQTSPKCRTVQFLMPAAGVQSGSDYWRLRVDFHPRLTTQPFELGLGTERPRIGGDDVEHNAAYICEAVKNNGVTAIW